MCQLQKRGTLELNTRRLRPTPPCRIAALDPLYRSVKFPQASINGSQVVFDPTGILKVDDRFGHLKTVCDQQALKGHTESAPKGPHGGNMDFSR